MMKLMMLLRYYYIKELLVEPDKEKKLLRIDITSQIEKKENFQFVKSDARF